MPEPYICHELSPVPPAVMMAVSSALIRRLSAFEARYSKMKDVTLAAAHDAASQEDADHLFSLYDFLYDMRRWEWGQY